MKTAGRWRTSESDSLTTRPFYESLGYWDFGTRTRSVGGVDIDFVVLCKRLDAN